MSDLTCGICGGPGRLTLADEADSMDWLSDELVHQRCLPKLPIGEPVDLWVGPPRRTPDELADMLFMALAEEEVLREALDSESLVQGGE